MQGRQRVDGRDIRIITADHQSLKILNQQESLTQKEIDNPYSQSITGKTKKKKTKDVEMKEFN